MARNTRPGCPNQVLLDQFAEKLLDTNEDQRISKHIEACVDCQRRLKQIHKNRVFIEELKCVFNASGTESLENNTETATLSLASIQPGQLTASDADSTLAIDGSGNGFTGGDSEGNTPTPQDETLSVASGLQRTRKVSQSSYPEIPNYEIIREINRGGQGVVYEAVQESTGRTVAIKAMLGRHIVDDRMKWRFEQEVKLVAGIKHPNIVTIHDSGSEEGIHYYVMEYVNGQPLDTYVRLNNPSVRETVRLFILVCEGVSVAHRHGVIHRDLKPSNILVNEEGSPQVLDFGLAKVAGEKSRIVDGRPVTEEGNIMGTLRYMSPEQTLGDPDAVDASSDIYSLGVILYEILLRVPPYKTDVSDLYDAIATIREAEPQRPSKLRSDVDRDVDAIVLKALEKEPGRRYLAVAEFQSDLIAWMQGRPVMARSASSLYVLRKIARKHWMASFVASLILVILVSATSIAVQGWRAKQAGDQQFQKGVTIANNQRGLLDQEYQVGLVQTRKQILATYLWMMSQGYRDSAELLRHKLHDGTIERLATDFLLDSGYSEDQLLADLGSENRSLGLFLIGERHYLHGNIEQAAQSFELVQAVQPSQQDWVELSNARLKGIAMSRQNAQAN